MTSLVRNRHVLFIPGFDPAPARSHRERYRSEGQAQAEISGYALQVTSDPGTDPAAWEAVTTIDGAQTHARIEVLIWSDLVRDAMTDPKHNSYVLLWKTMRAYIGTGALWRLMRLRRGPVIAALYPVVALIVQWLVAAAVAVAAGIALFLGGEAIYEGLIGAVEPPRPVLLLLSAATLWLVYKVLDGVLRWFKAHDGRVLAHYLIQDYAFTAAQNGRYDPALEDRLPSFTERLIEAAEGPCDEVLLVGHSSGAYLAVTVLADALRSGRIPQGKVIGLLTLGQVVPMVSFLPDANRLRGDLQALSAARDITWIDVSAPGDGCAFALCDPVAVSGVAGPGKRWPLVISAAFSQTLKRDTWQRLRWRFLRLHFQYMCAFDGPADYDFFAITAGPQRLCDRFAGRAPSPGRIDRALNPYPEVTR